VYHVSDDSVVDAHVCARAPILCILSAVSFFILTVAADYLDWWLLLLLLPICYLRMCNDPLSYTYIDKLPSSIE